MPLLPRGSRLTGPTLPRWRTSAGRTAPHPVIGLGEATVLHACTLGRKIGLVTTNPVFIPYHVDQIARHGLQRRVVAVQAVQAQTRAVQPRL